MKKLRKNFLILSSAIVLLSSTSQADSCTLDCRDALNKADKLIGTLKEEISVYKKITEKQQEHIVNIELEAKEKGDQLRSPLRNPILMIGVGVLVCGLGQAFNPQGAICGLFQK